ncbi:protein of unknown function [Hyphomicrobium sp. 1Nfss2.1]
MVMAARRIAAQLWGTEAEYLCHVHPPNMAASVIRIRRQRVTTDVTRITVYKLGMARVTKT